MRLDALAIIRTAASEQLQGGSSIARISSRLVFNAQRRRRYKQHIRVGVGRIEQRRANSSSKSRYGCECYQPLASPQGAGIWR